MWLASLFLAMLALMQRRFVCRVWPFTFLKAKGSDDKKLKREVSYFRLVFCRYLTIQLDIYYL